MNFWKICKEFFKEHFNIKLVFSSFKSKNYFSYNDLIRNDLKSFLVYSFSYNSYNSLCFKIIEKTNLELKKVIMCFLLKLFFVFTFTETWFATTGYSFEFFFWSLKYENLVDNLFITFWKCEDTQALFILEGI